VSLIVVSNVAPVKRLSFGVLFVGTIPDVHILAGK